MTTDSLFGEPLQGVPAGHEELFAAPREHPDTGAHNPTPRVRLNFEYLRTGPGDLTGPVVLDDFELTWGRSDVLALPEPATGTVRLFDPTKRWATGKFADLRGLVITLRWSLDIPGIGIDERVFFRGRVSGQIKVTPKTVFHDGRQVDGAIIELPVVSGLVDLANRTPTDAWPLESIQERRDRLLALVPDVLTGIRIRDAWLPGPINAVDANDQVSLLEHLDRLMLACGADRYSYRPHTSDVVFQTRRDYPSVLTTAQLWWETTGSGARVGKGVYIRARQMLPATDTDIGDGGWLDAAAVDYDWGQGITQPEKISRVQLSFHDAYVPDDYRIESQVSGLSESATGIRAASLNTDLAASSWAAVQLGDLTQMVRGEGSAWNLQPITVRTAATGGFSDYRQAYYLLAGYESNTVMFLARSMLPGFGIRPVYGVMGGTIAYRDGGWEVTCTLGACFTTQLQHAITWEQFDDGTVPFTVQWHDGDHLQGMHESLTYEDLGYVGAGLGPSITITTDPRWDDYQ